MGLLFDVAPAEHALASLLAYVHPGIDLTPTSRITNATTRATRISALSALIDDFDATIDAVACLEGTLASLMLGLRQRRARIKTAMAPVTGLPTETLLALTQAPVFGSVPRYLFGKIQIKGEYSSELFVSLTNTRFARTGCL